MKPYVSIVIPHYNNPRALEQLIRSIASSKKAPPYEIIVVDDGSTNELRVKSSQFTKIRKKLKSVNRELYTIYLSENMGPSVARNRGVSVARGEYIVFMDCDVEVFPDTLYQLAKVFRDDEDVVALTGVWVKEQRSHKFFPNFKAMRDWSYWINERDKSGYYFLFSTRIAAIKKAVFTRLGGFDEDYPAPLVEDIELTYRIARRYAIIFAPQVRVRHEFESFWPVARKYYLRAYYWTKLYSKRKKFDPVATTFSEAITTLSGASIVVLTILSFISNVFLPVLIVIVLLHLYLVRKFLVFAYWEKGVVFAVKSFVMGIILYCFIAAGACVGKLEDVV